MKIDMDAVFGLTPSYIGTCENCGAIDIEVRQVQSYAGDFGSDSRGYFAICYSCYGEHVKFWTGKGRNRMVRYASKEK